MMQNQKNIERTRSVKIATGLIMGMFVLSSCALLSQQPSNEGNANQNNTFPVGEDQGRSDTEGLGGINDVTMEKDDDAMMEKDDDAMTEKDDDAMMEKDDDAMTEKDDDAMMEQAQIFNIGGTNFAFDVKEIRVKQGDTVRINFTSNGGFHDWVVDEFDAATAQVNEGQSTFVEFVADTKGTFEYYCSVGQHREMGMVGMLIVE